MGFCKIQKEKNKGRAEIEGIKGLQLHLIHSNVKFSCLKMGNFVQ